MSDRLILSTRKGLFVAERSNGWTPRLVGFLAENVTLMFPDPRDGTWYAALNLGHFGVKLKASKDEGKTWEDRAVPAYPEGETVATGVPETIVVVDTRNGTIRWDLDVDLPPSAVQRFINRSNVYFVDVHGDRIDFADGRVNLGRSNRLANRAA